MEDAHTKACLLSYAGFLTSFIIDGWLVSIRGFANAFGSDG